MIPRPTSFRHLDLNLLRVFDVVMVERNVTRAASRLAMTQPAVSNALRRLRDSTHEDLFVPTSTGVTPTPHAEMLWPRVRSSLEGLRDAFEPHRFDPGTAVHTFTLAMADATAALFAPLLLADLQRAGPGLDLRIVPLTSRDPRGMLEHGQADAAVGFFPDVTLALGAEGDHSVLVTEPLYACRYACVMRHDHPLAVPGALTLASYCAADHLRVNFAGRPRGYVDAALAPLGRSRRVVITVNQFFSAASVVHQSDLLSVMPGSFVPATGFAPRLAVRPLPFELPTIDVSLLWHARHASDTAHAWLRARLASAAAQIAEASRVLTDAPAEMAEPPTVRPGEVPPASAVALAVR